MNSTLHLISSLLSVIKAVSDAKSQNSDGGREITEKEVMLIMANLMRTWYLADKKPLEIDSGQLIDSLLKSGFAVDNKQHINPLNPPD
jgi:hypothetical protein